MGNKYSSGRHAIADCDRCGFRFKLKELRTLVIKTKNVNVYVCRSCWEPDHPQLQLGMYPVEDPQALRNARPDRTYTTSGTTVFGTLGGGSRDIQWGWAPVGGSQYNERTTTPNNLVATTRVGAVTINVT